MLSSIDITNGVLITNLYRFVSYKRHDESLDDWYRGDYYGRSYCVGKNIDAILND